jgi:transcriptional regulator with XRE-family HTH domain
VDIRGKLKTLRSSMGLSQEKFAERLGITRASVSAYEEGRAEPNLTLLEKIADLTSISIDSLVRSNTPLQEREALASSTNQVRIPLVPIKAAAGYQRGYPDASFVQELPHLTLPFLGPGDMRAFEITGDSMLPIPSGTIIIGERLEKLNQVKDGKPYILVTKSEGIVFKRVFNYLKDKGVLYLVSDNKRFKPYSLDPMEVNEIWLSKAFISTEFPE